MKSILLTCLIIITTTSTLWAKPLLCPGQIIYDNDTVNVTLLLPYNRIMDEPILNRIQRGITYLDENNEEKIINSIEANEVRFTVGNENYRMVSKNLRIRKNQYRVTWIRLRIEGEMRLYSLDGDADHHYYIEIKNKKLFEPRPVSQKVLRFNKNILDYVKDCRVVASKIESNELWYTDLRLVVTQYNFHCSSK